MVPCLFIIIFNKMATYHESNTYSLPELRSQMVPKYYMHKWHALYISALLRLLLWLWWIYIFHSIDEIFFLENVICMSLYSSDQINTYCPEPLQSLLYLTCGYLVHNGDNQFTIGDLFTTWDTSKVSNFDINICESMHGF